MPTLRSLGVDWGGVAVVVGEEAPVFADACFRSGGQPLAASTDSFALLTRDPPAGDLAATSDLAGDSAGLVVMRHAWDGVEGLLEAVAEARRLLAPGGTVVLAEWDLDRILRSPARLYPDGFFYAALPEVVPRLRAMLAAPTDLAVELIRAGFKDVEGVDVDETVVEVPDRLSYLEFAKQRSFRGSGLATPDRLAAAWTAFVDFVPRIAPIGPVTHREPWRVVRGRVPG